MKETEKIDQKTIGISKMPINRMVNTIIDESYKSFNAVKNAGEKISHLTEIIYNKAVNGGRIIYIGAGTSGRIATQDVIELYPTYGIGNNIFDYIMVGGKKALYKSVENSEDNTEQAIIDLKRKYLNQNDITIGISASGQTPYVLSALKYGKLLNVYTVGIVNNNGTEIEKIADYTIILNTGPEVIQGSTRMNAGTSQKILLNTLSTSIAILLGKTLDNAMGSMKSNFNKKLRERAINIIVQNFNISNKDAKNILSKHNYDIESAIGDIKGNHQ